MLFHLSCQHHEVRFYVIIYCSRLCCCRDEWVLSTRHHLYWLIECLFSVFFYIDVSAISYHWRSYTPVDELGPTVHIFSGYYRQSIDLTVRTSPLPVIAICIWYFFYAMLQCLSIILFVRYDFGWLVELFIISVVWYTNTILDTNAELSIFYLHDVSPW